MKLRRKKYMEKVHGKSTFHKDKPKQTKIDKIVISPASYDLLKHIVAS